MSWDRLITAVAAAAALAGGGASVFSRAALADVEGRVRVLESQRTEDKEAIKRIDSKLDAIYSILVSRGTSR